MTFAWNASSSRHDSLVAVLTPTLTRRRIRALGLSFSTLLLVALGIGCASSPRGLEYDANLSEWAVGIGRRTWNGAPSSAFLLVVNPDTPSVGAGSPLTDCVPAVSMLPVSYTPTESAAYFVVGGRLWLWSTARDPKLQEVHELPAGFILERLLAFEVDNEGRRLLVAGKSAMARRQRYGSDLESEYWLLDLRDSYIDASEEVEVAELGKSREQFFARFRVPRCGREDRDCLVVSTDEMGSYVDLEPERGGARREFLQYDDVAILDAGWADPASRDIYLLVGDCDE